MVNNVPTRTGHRAAASIDLIAVSCASFIASLSFCFDRKSISKVVTTNHWPWVQWAGRPVSPGDLWPREDRTRSTLSLFKYLNLLAITACRSELVVDAGSHRISTDRY